MMDGWRRARDAVTATTERLSAAAADTRAAVMGAVLLALAALGVALLALAVSARRRTIAA